MSEIQDLYLQLEVDSERATGKEKPFRIRALLLELAQGGRLPELLTIAQSKHPHVVWPPVPEGLEKPEALFSADRYQVYSDLVLGDKVEGDKIAGHKIQVQNYIERQVVVQRGEIADLEQLPPEKGEPPYKGLSYFTEVDSDWFFGREKATAVLINRLHDQNFLAVVGASGSGKSSLVRAG